jgi:hypothetical protein
LVGLKLFFEMLFFFLNYFSEMSNFKEITRVGKIQNLLKTQEPFASDQLAIGKQISNN